jgi:ATP phosphoribosyltransferase
MEYQPGYVKFALPKGRFLSPTANLLDEVGLGFSRYSNRTRQYRLQSSRFPYLSAKIFQEKDIPIQVAVGNYDLGICGLDWIEELLVRYPASVLVKIASLGYGEGSIYVTSSNRAGIASLDKLSAQRSWRIVSEYPNLAESLALNLRMREFRIFPIWGAAEVYPPESADLAILWEKNEDDVESQGLVSLAELLPVTAFVIANRESLENKDLSQILSCLSKGIAGQSNNVVTSTSDITGVTARSRATKQFNWQTKAIKLALPDGHQQSPTSRFLEQSGLDIPGYSKGILNRRPSTDLDWLDIKVIRPQDMPLQVANGNFDLAITGKDWLLEHLYRFPSSSVKELLNLGFGEVKIVAAVSRDIPVNSIAELKTLAQSGKLAPVRVASEYINIADKYLRDNHINPYKLLPTWGASEAFLPEDADLLIDNTQTGKTLAEHKLKIIEVLFQSTACLIGNKNSIDQPAKKEKIEFLIQKFQFNIP